MNVEIHRPVSNHLPRALQSEWFEAPLTATTPSDVAPSDPLDALERAVDYVVNDCFFTVGQVVGTRKAIDYEAVIWWRDHYRRRFLGAMRAFGNRWLADRENVTGVAFLLAERATRYAGDAASIDVNAARKAAADVERYCQLHATRHPRAMGTANEDVERPLMLGYWCTRRSLPRRSWPRPGSAVFACSEQSSEP